MFGVPRSSNPVPKKKDYVIPLIRKVVWRGVEEGEGGKTEGVSGGVSNTDQAKTNEKLTLDKEAAKAILSGMEICIMISRICNQSLYAGMFHNAHNICVNFFLSSSP